MSNDLPRVQHEGTIDVCGLRLRTYVLDDGRRLINGDDVKRLVKAWQDGVSMSSDEAKRLAGWMLGERGRQ